MNINAVFSDGSAIDAINEYFQTEYKQCVEAAALEKEIFAGDAEYSGEKTGSSYTITQYKTAVAGTYTSDYNFFNILNVFSIEDTYGGGAYLYERTSCAVFSLKTGARISLADLFTVDAENYVNRLSDEMYTALKNENHLYTTEGYANRKEDVFKVLKAYITDDTFALSENGLIIMVEPIAAQYVPATIFSITIPYERIQDIMIPPGDIVTIPA